MLLKLANSLLMLLDELWKLLDIPGDSATRK
jgi:hypothetical protein